MAPVIAVNFAAKPTGGWLAGQGRNSILTETETNPMIMLRNVARNRQLALYCNGVMQYYANLLAKSQAWPAVVAGTGVAKWRGSGGIQREREK